MAIKNTELNIRTSKTLVAYPLACRSIGHDVKDGTAHADRVGYLLLTGTKFCVCSAIKDVGKSKKSTVASIKTESQGIVQEEEESRQKG